MWVQLGHDGMLFAKDSLRFVNIIEAGPNDHDPLVFWLDQQPSTPRRPPSDCACAIGSNHQRV